MKSRKGLFYTVAMFLIIIPLIVLITYYSSLDHSENENKIEKIRCDELHYFVEDVREDLQRAMVIFGRRAVIYALDEVVESGNPLDNYGFNCTQNCLLNCSTFNMPLNGSEAAITELAVCGTIRGENVTFMVNHTLSQWLGRILDQGNRMNFNLSVELNSVDVIPKDAWTFAVFTNATYTITDKAEACYYQGESLTTSSYTSILGLEDPLYPLNTNSYVIRYINNCSIVFDTHNIAGCSVQDSGNGSSTGDAVFLSEVSVGDRGTYCEDHQLTVNDLILVVDTAFGTAPCSAANFDQHCFNISSPFHFAAAINYDKNREQPFVENCDLTIPWIAATGDIDEYSPTSPGWDRAEGCDVTNISEYECIAVYNSEDCNDHQVLVGKNWDEYNTSCYMQSDASLYGGVDGPSFFDRLEGRLSLSEKYVNQSLEYFNNSIIGIETLINPSNLEMHGVNPNENLSWVDYYYWAEVEGCNLQGVCKTDGIHMKLDDPHTRSFKVNTDCEIGMPCYTGFEYCVDCIDQDNDTELDWLDEDCVSYFSGCGTIAECDPLDTNDCNLCDDNPPTILMEDDSTYCHYYGFNTTEWHFYQINPAFDARLNITFNGTSSALSDEKTDLIIYPYSEEGNNCQNPTTYLNLEDVSSVDLCVSGGETYIIGVDVDSGSCGNVGSYELSNEIIIDPVCGSITTSTSTTTSTTYTIMSTSSTTSTSTTSTSTTIPCGFFDDMENGEGIWIYGEEYGDGEWELGIPQWGSAYSGNDCWATDLSNSDADGNDRYEHWTEQWLRSPRIDISAVSTADLTFYHKYWIRDGRWHTDTAYLEVSDDAVNWVTLDTFSGSDSSWSQETYDISSYTGGDVYIRFRLQSDGTRRNRGWYIDDFEIIC